MISFFLFYTNAGKTFSSYKMKTKCLPCQQQLFQFFLVEGILFALEKMSGKKHIYNKER